jgi:hypothetical protein
MKPHDGEQPAFRRRAWGLRLAGAILLTGVAVWALLTWAMNRDGLLPWVSREVRDGLPPGTPRQRVEAWLTQRYGYIPTYYPRADVSANRIRGRTIPELAGVPEDELGGMVFVTVRRPGPLGAALERVRYDHVQVYVLLDEDQRVKDYFFFSFDDLRRAEADPGW